MNQATDIVSEHLQQNFVDLRYSRFAAHGVPEHSLDGRERGFDIRPLVICLQKLFAVQDEILEQFVWLPFAPLMRLVVGVGVCRALWPQIILQTVPRALLRKFSGREQFTLKGAMRLLFREEDKRELSTRRRP
jgi:hypothetical protein